MEALCVFLDFELTALTQLEKFLSLVSGFDLECDVDPDPSFREIMKDVELFNNTLLSVLTLVMHISSRASVECIKRNSGCPGLVITFCIDCSSSMISKRITIKDKIPI